MKVLRKSTVADVEKALHEEVKCCSQYCRCLADSGG